MSKINVSRNLFLEKEELNRLQKFISDEGYKRSFADLILSPGFLLDENDNFDNSFLLEAGSAYNKARFNHDSVAYNKNGERLTYKNQSWFEIGLPATVSDSASYKVYIRYKTTNKEIGTVNLSSNGVLSGTNTMFTEVFRGVSTLVPNKIQIWSATPTTSGGDCYTYVSQGIFEVNEVISDTSMVINAKTSLPAGTYVYSVVGAFSPGTYEGSRIEGIYSNDSFEVLFYHPYDLIPKDGLRFLIADVVMSGSSSTITDRREDIVRFSLGADFVRLINNQTIDGVKTFLESPIVPTPQQDEEAANKGVIIPTVRTEFSKTVDVSTSTYAVDFEGGKYDVVVATITEDCTFSFHNPTRGIPQYLVIKKQASNIVQIAGAFNNYSHVGMSVGLTRMVIELINKDGEAYVRQITGNPRGEFSVTYPTGISSFGGAVPKCRYSVVNDICYIWLDLLVAITSSGTLYLSVSGLPTAVGDMEQALSCCNTDGMLIMADMINSGQIRLFIPSTVTSTNLSISGFFQIK